MSYDEMFAGIDTYFAEDFLLGMGIFILIVGLIVLAFFIVTYVLQAIGLMRLAKKHNIPNPWLAWVPVGCMYLLGKLGFEVYAPEGKKNETFTWILFGLAAAGLVFFDSGIGYLIDIGIIVFTTWAYYNIFAKINSKNCVLFTVLTAIFSVGGIILFFNTRKLDTNINNTVNESHEENTETEKPKYCSNCGNQLNKTSKFCGKCGSQI